MLVFMCSDQLKENFNHCFPTELKDMTCDFDTNVCTFRNLNVYSCILYSLILLFSSPSGSAAKGQREETHETGKKSNVC